MYVLATRLTRVALDQNRVISAGSIRVTGVVVSNGTGAAVTVVFRDREANNVMDITVPTNDTVSFNIPFVADKGLNIVSASSADVVVTVAHGADGA
jgi:hypothetical protein